MTHQNIDNVSRNGKPNDSRCLMGDEYHETDFAEVIAAEGKDLKADYDDKLTELRGM
ncbi:MAG: hypothetical protein V5783_06875 [Pontiella sp.]